jgi:hypothetical protein
VLFLVGDNTNTNPAIAAILHTEFVGCKSHLLNLAVQAYLVEYKDLLAML